MLTGERNYYSLLENLHAGVIVHAPDTSIIFCNKQAEIMLGYHLSAISGKKATDSIWEFRGEDGSPLTYDEFPVIKVIRSGQPVKNLVIGGRIHTPSPVWTLINAFPEFDAAGNLEQVVVTLLDITEKKLQEESFRLKYRAFEHAMEGIVMTYTKKPLHIIYCSNPGFETISGYKGKDIVDREMDFLYGPDTAPEKIASIKKRLQENVPFDQVIRLYKKNGTPFWCALRISPVPDNYGIITHFIWFFHDITEIEDNRIAKIQSENILHQAQKVARIGNYCIHLETQAIDTSVYFDEIMGLLPDTPKNVATCLYHVYPEFQAPIARRLQEVQQTGERFEEDFKVARANDGEERWVSVFGEVTYDTDGQPNTLQGVIQDITDRKKAEIALRESEYLVDDIFNLSPVPLVLSRISDGKIIKVNAALVELAGAGYEIMTNYQTLDFYDNPDARTLILEEMGRKGHVRNLELRLKKFNGAITPCLLSSDIITMDGEKLLFSGIVDISERKNAEEVIQANEKLLRDVFNSSPIAQVITRISDGEIIMANKTAIKMSGAESLDAISVSSFYERPEERQKVLDGIAANGRVENMELRLRPVNGFSAEGLVSTSIIQMHGEPMLFTGFIDISDRKKVEDELNRSLHLVNEQNKRLINFSYIVSHNLRSHAGNIKSILDFLALQPTETERKELIQHLRTVTDRLDETLFDLNEVVSIQRNINLSVEPLGLHEYVQKATQVLHEQIQIKKALIQNHIPRDIIVNYNPAYLESILLNFISNTLKYAHPDRSPIVELRIEYVGEKLVLLISDNGLGIDLNKYGDKLFGMYKTFHDNKDAKGIGLFITQNQVDAMGGKIEVKSTPGVGTTFKIYF